tara:strand:- start:5671 stop:7032 length:1362 start_codon:yes stop_codon:yes gene_type:complete
MGFFNVSDAMALGLIEGADMAFENIRVQEKEDYDNAKRKAEKASIVAGEVTAKYKQQEKLYEITGQSLLKDVAFQKAINNLRTKYPEEFAGVSDAQIATRFGKSYILHNSKDRNDSPAKYAVRAAQSLNEQVRNETVDPNLFSIKDVEKPIDIQTKELTTMEKMTPKGRLMEMEQSYRPSGIGGEAFDTAMKGGTPTVPVTQTESLVKSAREPNTRAEQRYQDEALLNALEFTVPVNLDGTINYDKAEINENSITKNNLTPDDVNNAKQQLFVLRGKFDAFLNKMNITPVDQNQILEAAQKFRTLFINKDFSFNEELFNKVNPNNIDQILQETVSKQEKDNKNKKPNTILVPIDPNQTSKPGLLKELKIESLIKKLRKKGLKPEEIEKQIELEKEKSFINNKPKELKEAERLQKILRVQKKAEYPFILEYGDMLIEFTSHEDMGTIVKDKTDG